MAYLGIQIRTMTVFATLGLLSGCFLMQDYSDDEAWPGVSAGTISSAPDFTAPVAGGQFGQRTPPDMLQNQYGYRGEDLSATAPSRAGGNGLYSYDSSAQRSDTSRPQTGGKGAKNANDSQMASQAGASFSGGDTVQGALASDSQAQTQQAPIAETGDPADPVEDWLAQEGMSLRGLLTEWSDKSGWRLIWSTDREYILEAGAMFRGRFMDVSSALVRSFARARPSPWATFYQGNRVLLVTTLEDENAD